MLISPARRTRKMLCVCLAAALVAGCHKDESTAQREAEEAPQSQPQVVTTGSATQVNVGADAKIPLVTVGSQSTFSTLAVTGQVQPDPAHEVPVLSIANGRVTALKVDMGDYVHKGQLVMDVQSPDVATAFDSYLKAVADEHLANITLTRDKLLFDKGAIAKSQLEVAEDGETDAVADLKAANQQLVILGVNKDHPGDSVHVYAPISGVVTALNTTASGAAGLTATGPSGSLTIADLSQIWVVCDVYENDLANVRLGDSAQITLNAFPGQPLTGTISDIGAVLDPNLRTGKVRIKVPNTDKRIRLGMFATAVFTGKTAAQTLAVPADAVLHLHDRDWVFVPSGPPGAFTRLPVVSGAVLPNGQVSIHGGVQQGQKVAANALQLQEMTEQ